MWAELGFPWHMGGCYALIVQYIGNRSNLLSSVWCLSMNEAVDYLRNPDYDLCDSGPVFMAIAYELVYDKHGSVASRELYESITGAKCHLCVAERG